jgi:hypothetical protein
MKFKLASPVVSIIAGVLVLVFPDLLRLIVGGYLILVGVLSLSNK